MYMYARLYIAVFVLFFFLFFVLLCANKRVHYFIAQTLSTLTGSREPLIEIKLFPRLTLLK